MCRTVAAATVVACLICAGGASAKTCPNSSTSTVSGTPSYSRTRGCIVSFDSTPIVYNLFEPQHPSAGSLFTILEGPGWGGPGGTSPDPKLIAAGYAELTWDPRGFGQSGGVAEVDAPSAEGRDVSALIDKVLAGRPEIAVDQGGKDGQPDYLNDHGGSNTIGQPVVGMAGGSYGGGIQLSTASFDMRVKAMAPALSWNNLNYSLWPGNVIKLGWGELLYGAGLATGTEAHVLGDASGAPSGGDGGVQTGGYDPNIHYAEVTGATLGYPDRQTLAWFGQRSIAVFGAGPAGHTPAIPTLMIQGTVDTLFNLTDAWNTVVEIKAHHPKAPVKMIAFCGGHVACPTGPPPTGANYSATASKSSPIGAGQSAGTFTENQTIAWFNHYLRGQGQSDGMAAPVVYQDQNGNFYGLPTFPTPAAPGPATYQSAPVAGTLVAHGVPSGFGPAGVDTVVTDGATNAGDPGQFTVTALKAPAQSDVPIVGTGRLTATVTVDGTATELFFRLIDEATGDVVDLQTVPLRVDNLDLQNDGGNPTLPPAPQTISVDLPGTAYDLPAGDTLGLQVSTSTDSYSPNRGSAVVSVANGKVELPTLAPEG